jgi:hypothetical protein
MLFYDLFRNDPTFLVFEPGDILLQEGDVGHEMHVLIEGKAVIEHGGLFFAEIGPGILSVNWRLSMALHGWPPPRP